MNAEIPKHRRSTSVTLDPALLEEARALKVDVARACDRGLAQAVREARWQEENREAIESSNAWVEKHGPPLAKYRLF